MTCLSRRFAGWATILFTNAQTSTAQTIELIAYQVDNLLFLVDNLSFPEWWIPFFFFLGLDSSVSVIYQSVSGDRHLRSWSNFHKYNRCPWHCQLPPMLMRAMATALTHSGHKSTLGQPSNTLRLHTGHQGQSFFQRSWHWPNFLVQHLFLLALMVLHHATHLCDSARGCAQCTHGTQAAPDCLALEYH